MKFKILNESKATALQKYGNKIPTDIFNELLELDYTPSKKYIEFLSKIYLQNPSYFENNKEREYVIYLLKKFEKFSNKLKIKDINAYEKLLDLENSLQFNNKNDIDINNNKFLKDIIYEDKYWRISYPTSFQSSRYFAQSLIYEGLSANWCTAKSEMDYEKLLKLGLIYFQNKLGNVKKDWTCYAITTKGDCLGTNFYDNGNTVGHGYGESGYIFLKEIGMKEWVENKFNIIIKPSIVYYCGADINNMKKHEIVHLLKQIDILFEAGANPNEVNAKGWTPFYAACKRNNTDFILDYVLKFSTKKSINQENNKGYTPIYQLIFNNNIEVLGKLLSKGLVNVNYINKNNNTPLFWACKNNNIKIVKLLLENGASESILKPKNLLQRSENSPEINNLLNQYV